MIPPTCDTGRQLYTVYALDLLAHPKGVSKVQSEKLKREMQAYVDHRMKCKECA